MLNGLKLGLLLLSFAPAWTFAQSSCAPVAAADAYSTNWDTTLNVAAPGVLANDLNSYNGTLEAFLVQGPATGYLSLGRNGAFRYQPVPGVSGPVTFTYKSWNGCGYAVETVTIEVNAGNQFPVVANDNYCAEPGIRLTIGAPGVLVNDFDPEGAPLTAYLVTQPQVGVLGFNQDGSFWYEAPADYLGNVSFTYRAGDGRLKTLGQVNIRVCPKVIANPDYYTTDWDTVLVVPAPGVLANDINHGNGRHEAHLLRGPNQGYLSIAHDGSFTYRPVPGVAGPITFVYKSWNGCTYEPATVTIDVTPGNLFPVVNADEFCVSVPQWGDYYASRPGVLANDTDPEGNRLTAYLVTPPAVGKVMFYPEGDFHYIFPAGYVGDVTFVYAAGDGRHKSQGTVTLHVGCTEVMCPEAALEDQHALYAGGHALTLPGIGDTFLSENLKLITAENGTAKLSGIIYDADQPNRRFALSMDLVGESTVAPSAPKLELKSSAYADQGGPVNPANWTFYAGFTARLTGMDALEGAIVELSPVGPAFQMGNGANGKNQNFGASTWFNWTLIQQGNTMSLPSNGTGDVNVDLVDCH